MKKLFLFSLLFIFFNFYTVFGNSGSINDSKTYNIEDINDEKIEDIDSGNLNTEENIPKDLENEDNLIDSGNLNEQDIEESDESIETSNSEKLDEDNIESSSESQDLENGDLEEVSNNFDGNYEDGESSTNSGSLDDGDLEENLNDTDGNDENEEIPTNSGSLENGNEKIEDNQNDDEISDNTEINSSNLDIPDIVIEVQSGLDYVGEGEYKCKKEECKINLSLEEIFTGSYDKNNYECVWDFGGGIFSTIGTDLKCNPGYVSYGTGIFDLGVRVLEKNNSENYKEKPFRIINYIEEETNGDLSDENDSGDSTNTGSLENDEEVEDNKDDNEISDNTEINSSNLEIPDIFIEVQSGLDYIGEGEYKCKKEECKINLSLEEIFTGSYDKNNYECVWDFGGGIFSTIGTDLKCNPGYVSYGTGIFDLSVKVLEKYNTQNYKEELFRIINSTETEQTNGDLSDENDIEDSTSSGILDDGDLEENSNDTNGDDVDEEIPTNSGNLENEEEIEDNQDYDEDSNNTETSSSNLEIPDIVIEIQSGLDYIGEGEYKCKKEECNINLSLEEIFTGSYDRNNYECVWDFGDGIFSTIGTDLKCNPGYVSYGTGIFDLSVRVLEKNNNQNYKEELFRIINDIETEETNGDLEENDIEDSTNSQNQDTGSSDENQIEAPSIFWSFQRPSYIFDSDKILSKYICDKSKDECKINLDLRDSFVGDFKEKDFFCEIDFGLGNSTGQEDKCNPNTVIFPIGDFYINFKIISKLDNSVYSNLGFYLENKEKIINSINDSSTSTNSSDFKAKQTISLKEIIIQSGLKKDGNQNYFCNKEICSINLIYLNENPDLLCSWDFGEGFFKTKNTDKKCNPGYVKYSSGKHKIKLTIYDKNYLDNYKETFLSFDNLGSDLFVSEENDLSQEIEEDIVFDFDNLANLKLGNISVNPRGSDKLEYIEIINNGDNLINLRGCYIDDILDGGSKRYIFKKDYFIFPKSSKKLYKKDTKLNLNNNGDEVNFFCGEKLIDKVKWNFTVKSGFLLNHKNTEIKSSFVEVVNVVDGDTFVIKFDSGNTEKIRLIGIDTPETKDPRKPVQFFGYKASNYSKENLLGKRVYLEIDPENYRDKYSRLLGYIHLNGESFNMNLVKNGYARVYDKFDFKYLNFYRKALEYAKNNKLGMWAFLNSDMENKLFLKYQKEIKQDQDFIQLEDSLDIDIEEIKEVQIQNKSYNDLITNIDQIYLNQKSLLSHNVSGIPSDFLVYEKIDPLLTNINQLPKEKQKIIGDYSFLLNEQKSMDSYKYFINNSFSIGISKLKSGLKIYGKTSKNSKVYFNLGNEIHILNSDSNGDFVTKITNPDKIISGDFEIKTKIIDEFGNIFDIEDSKTFNIQENYISELKLKIIEDEKKDYLQTFTYLDKNILSLEKDFDKNIKKLLKSDAKNSNNLSYMKKSSYKDDLLNLGEKLSKVQIYYKDVGYLNSSNQNKVIYYFYIMIFSFTLFFILIKRYLSQNSPVFLIKKSKKSLTEGII